MNNLRGNIRLDSHSLSNPKVHECCYVNADTVPQCMCKWHGAEGEDGAPAKAVQKPSSSGATGAEEEEMWI